VEGSEDRCQTSRLKNVERKTGLLTWVARTLTAATLYKMAVGRADGVTVDPTFTYFSTPAAFDRIVKAED
jgi:hypothetical protein